MSRQSFLGMIAIVVLAVIIAGVIWSRVRQRSPVSQNGPQTALESAVAKPAEFVKNRVTGGVGAALRIDPASGLIIVGGVLPGSPAQDAGLRPGDVVMSVNGEPTAGKSLEKVVESIRGFTGGKVDIAIKRTNAATAPQEMTFEIHRSSWNALGMTNSVTPTPARITNPAVFIQVAPGNTN